MGGSDLTTVGSIENISRWSYFTWCSTSIDGYCVVTRRRLNFCVQNVQVFFSAVFLFQLPTFHFVVEIPSQVSQTLVVNPSFVAVVSFYCLKQELL